MTRIAKKGKSYPIGIVFGGVPITYYATTLLGFVVYAGTGNLFWYKLGYFCNFAGIFTGLSLAVPSFFEWIYGIPVGRESQNRSLIYETYYVGALFLFCFNAFLLYGTWNGQPRNITGLLISSSIGVVLTLIEGGRGWQWDNFIENSDAPPFKLEHLEDYRKESPPVRGSHGHGNKPHPRPRAI